MTERHPDESSLVAYVQGAMADADALPLEAHVMACALCAERLRQHAWLEVAMTEAAGGVATTPEPVRLQPRRKPAQPSAGLALAASLVLGLGLPSRWIALDAGEPSGIASAATHGMSLAQEAPACDVPDGFGGPQCAETGFELEGAIAMMTMPEPAFDDGANACEDTSPSGLACDPLDG